MELLLLPPNAVTRAPCWPQYVPGTMREPSALLRRTALESSVRLTALTARRLLGYQGIAIQVTEVWGPFTPISKVFAFARAVNRTTQKPVVTVTRIAALARAAVSTEPRQSVSPTPDVRSRKTSLA